MIHDYPGKNHRGAEVHQHSQQGHRHSQVLPGYRDEAVELDDVNNVYEESDHKEETPGKHTEDPECLC